MGIGSGRAVYIMSCIIANECQHYSSVLAVCMLRIVCTCVFVCACLYCLYLVLNLNVVVVHVLPDCTSDCSVLYAPCCHLQHQLIKYSKPPPSFNFLHRLSFIFSSSRKPFPVLAAGVSVSPLMPRGAAQQHTIPFHIKRNILQALR